ncbi:hypothetical protein ACFL7E_04130 [Thermodesulfobacteriota bacterium]
MDQISQLKRLIRRRERQFRQLEQRIRKRDVKIKALESELAACRDVKQS